MKPDADRRQGVLGIIADLPEVVSEDANGHRGFSVRGRRFAWYLVDHHGDGRVSLNFKAEPGSNRDLVERYPDRYLFPAYTGNRGRVGLRLDLQWIDWNKVRALLVDAYWLVAPKSVSEKSGVADR